MVEVGQVWEHRFMAAAGCFPRRYTLNVVDAVEDGIAVLRVPGNPKDESQSVLGFMRGIGPSSFVGYRADLEGLHLVSARELGDPEFYAGNWYPTRDGWVYHDSDGWKFSHWKPTGKAASLLKLQDGELLRVA